MCVCVLSVWLLIVYTVLLLVPLVLEFIPFYSLPRSTRELNISEPRFISLPNPFCVCSEINFDKSNKTNQIKIIGWEHNWAQDSNKAEGCTLISWLVGSTWDCLGGYRLCPTFSPSVHSPWSTVNSAHTLHSLHRQKANDVKWEVLCSLFHIHVIVNQYSFTLFIITHILKEMYTDKNKDNQLKCG